MHNKNIHVSGIVYFSRSFTKIVSVSTLESGAILMSASSRQADLLTQLKLPIPPDTTTASRLLDFVLNGNNSRGQKAKEWRAITRCYWRRWVGKMVRIVQRNHPFCGSAGRVAYLKARTEQETALIKTNKRAKKPLPFTAVVTLPSGSSTILLEIHLTGLALTRGKTVQPRLFV